jgi:hypothetical protein
MSAYRYQGIPVSSAGGFSGQQATTLWLKYVDAINWVPGELDHQEFAAFSKAAFYGIEEEFAFNLVVDKMKRCGARSLRLSKIRHSLARAYSNGGDGLRGSVPPLQLPPVKPYDEALLKETVGEMAQKADENFFIERSPFTTWNRSPAGALHKLSLPGESIWATHDAYSPDGCLWTHRGVEGCTARWISVSGRPPAVKSFDPNFSCLSFFERNQRNIWFLSNPVDGEPHHHDRFTCGVSYHCLEAVSAWRYLVLETDVAPLGLWLALLAILPLRIIAIYFSGDRGYHALLRIDAASKLEADDICEVYKREYTPLGACQGTLSAFRLTRLPNCFRGQTGQLQRLIYLNSNPTGVPIKDQPVLRNIPPHENGTGR